MPAERRRAVTAAPGWTRPVVTLVAGMSVLMMWVVPGAVPAGAAPAANPPATVPPIATVVIAKSLPGFTVAPPGPTNGPLTATGFAAQSSDPAQAEQEFNQLAGAAGFAAYVRLWSDLHGPGKGANDVVVTLFRIPDPEAAATFEAGAQTQAEQGTGTTSFAVPSIPGAHGTTVHATSPAPAVEQVVVFRSGAYVAIVQLASSTGGSNPTTLTRADAIDVAYRQFLATGRATATAAPVAVPAPSGRTSWWPVVLIIVVVLALAAGAVLFFLRRRRGRGAAIPGPDPWADDGVLAAMGAVVVDPGTTVASAEGSPAGAPVPVPAAASLPETGDRAPLPTAGPLAQAGTEPVAPTPTVTGPAATARRSAESPRPPVEPPESPTPGTEPGWLPDPSGAPDHLRYWDGQAWTSHVAARAGDR